jgi:hypothetical protein
LTVYNNKKNKAKITVNQAPFYVKSFLKSALEIYVLFLYQLIGNKQNFQKPKVFLIFQFEVKPQPQEFNIEPNQ